MGAIRLAIIATALLATTVTTMRYSADIDFINTDTDGVCVIYHNVNEWVAFTDLNGDPLDASFDADCQFVANNMPLLARGGHNAAG